MTTELQKTGRDDVALARRSDASQDAYVLKHMALGDLILRADSYTQSAVSGAVQVALASMPFGVAGAVVTGSVLGGLAAGALALVVVSLLMFLETSNRIVVTDKALVVQMGAFLRRYERDRIEDPRAERPRRRDLLRFEVMFLHPAYVFMRSDGLRFRYRKPNGKRSEVFVAVEGAEEYAALLRDPARES